MNEETSAIPSPENVKTGKSIFLKYKSKKKENFCCCFASVASAWSGIEGKEK